MNNKNVLQFSNDLTCRKFEEVSDHRLKKGVGALKMLVQVQQQEVGLKGKVFLSFL